MSAMCFYCDAEATKLCDFHIGCVIDEYVRVGAKHSNRWRAVMSAKNGTPFYTCDRQLCDACTTNKGHIFSCGTAPFVDTYDRCKDHATLNDIDAPMLLPAEAEEIRRGLHLRLTPPRGKAELVKP